MEQNNRFPEPTKGQLEVIGLLYMRREQYWLDYFWQVRLASNSFFNKISHQGLVNIQKRAGNLSNPQAMRTYLLDAADKINACFYHLEQLKSEEKSIIKLAIKIGKSRNLPPNIFGFSGFPTEVITHETESFLWSFESCLEIFSRGVSYYFNGEAKFKALSNMLQQTRVESKKAKAIILILSKDKYLPIFEEVEPRHPKKSKRDLISHYRSLKMIQTGLQFNNNKQFVLKAHLKEDATSDFTSQKPITLEKHLSKLLYLLCDLQIETLGVIFDKDFKAGKRMSVLNARKFKKK